jgi:hypothetical protein
LERNFHLNICEARLFILSFFEKEVKKCHNLSLGLETKARACKSASKKGISEITSHAPGSVRECEGINPHTLK